MVIEPHRSPPRAGFFVSHPQHGFLHGPGLASIPAQKRNHSVSLRRLKYFVKIVDVGSVTLASDVLHVAQPALSQHIATLEAEFNQQLLVRTPNGNDYGKALVAQYFDAHPDERP